MSEQNNIPELRFLNFNGEWGKGSFGDICKDVMYGMNAAATKFDGKHKYLRITDIDEDSREFMPSPLSSPKGNIESQFKLESGDIVFTRTGASVGKSYLYKETDGDLYFAGFLIKFSIKDANPYFVYTVTLRNKYNKWVSIMSVRSGQPGINAEEYKSYKFNFPTLPEQQKIASFFTATDKKITQLKQKKNLLEQYKKGVIQKIFSQEIRFRNENGQEFPKWEIKKMGEIVKINQGLQIAISERYTEQIVDTHFYITNEFIKANSKKKYFIKDPPKSVICNKDDILMTRTGNTGIVVTDVEGAFHNNFFKVAYPNYISKGFLYEFLTLSRTQNIISKLAGTSTIPDLNHSDFYRIEITFPSLLEQTKIADFIAAINNKISHSQTQIEKAELWKKGLLQKMFI